MNDKTFLDNTVLYDAQQCKVHINKSNLSDCDVT